MDFTGKIIVERTRSKDRASVKEQGTHCRASPVVTHQVGAASQMLKLQSCLFRIRLPRLCSGKQFVRCTDIRC
jgi:hypothetical protein